MVWHVVWQPWSARSYGEERTRTRETMTPLPLSIPPVTLRNGGSPYHETGENRAIVTLRYNAAPRIESRCAYAATGALARGAKERETLDAWREALLSARRWSLSARCSLARGARKGVSGAVEHEALPL